MAKTITKTAAKTVSKTVSKTAGKAVAKPVAPAKPVAKPVDTALLKPAAVKTVARPVQKAADKAAAKAVSSQVSRIAANIAAKAAAKEAIKAKNELARNELAGTGAATASVRNGGAKSAAKIELSENELAALTMIRTFSPPVQPVAPLEPEAPKVKYKYQVGDAVYFTSPSFGRAAASGTYTVIKVLPSDGEDRQYRIKSSVEAFERVAKESQLERI